MKAKNIGFERRVDAAAYTLFIFLLLRPDHVLGQVPFYQGKTITVISGQEPGGTGALALERAKIHNRLFGTGDGSSHIARRIGREGEPNPHVIAAQSGVD